MADRLPSELTTEILTRLPVKTLVQLRCVCKSWRSLISSSNFINSKLNQTIHLNKINTDDSLLVVNYINKRKTNGGGRLSVNLYDETLGRRLIQLQGPTPTCTSNFQILDSCNGLLCLTHGVCDNAQNLILWNPIIRKCVSLPSPSSGIVRSVSFDPCRVVFGFGYDSKTNDYKVVRIRCINLVPNPEIELYSLNSGCWRRICVVGLGRRHRFWFGSVSTIPPQAFVNGVVHWVGRVRDAASEHGSILTFDMSSEVFGEMEVPIGPEDRWMAVSVVRESLCLGHYNSSEKKVSIWVMKEYGVIGSWTKLFCYDLGYSFGGTLGFRRNGDLLLLKKIDHMYSVNLESGQLKDLGIRIPGPLVSPGSWVSPYVATYMESLALI